MAAEEYVVYPAADQKWGLQFMGRPLATFAERAQAIRAAVTIARATAGPERPAIVLSEGSDGASNLIGASAKDRFPTFTS